MAIKFRIANFVGNYHPQNILTVEHFPNYGSMLFVTYM